MDRNNFLGVLLLFLGFLAGLWLAGNWGGAPQWLVQAHAAIGSLALALLRGMIQLLVLLLEGLVNLLRGALARLPPP